MITKSGFEIVSIVLDTIPRRLRVSYRILSGEEIGAPKEIYLWEDLNWTIPSVHNSTHLQMTKELVNCIHDMLEHAEYVISIAIQQSGTQRP